MIHHDIQIQDLYRELLETEAIYPCRTGHMCKFVHAAQLTFDLTEGKVPATTTKFIPMKKVFHELEWFLKGLTDVSWLQKRNVRIWDEWVDHPINSMNKRARGSLGPIYGHQWRRFGQAVIDVKSDPGNPISVEGVDQIAVAQETLRGNPFSRRNIVSAWNPREVNCVVLPPCHTMFQFNVIGYDLYCSLVCRSTDAFLGLPWNILAYGYLTHIMAHLSGLNPKELKVTMNNCHLYENHHDQAREVIARRPMKEPSIKLGDRHHNAWDYSWDDISVLNYEYHPSIPGDVAI